MYGKELQRLRKTNRKAWLNIRTQHPSWGRLQIKVAFQGLYSWLYRHDREWQLENSPPTRQCQVKRSYADWETRDIQLAGQVKATAARLFGTIERPIRVSITAVARRLRITALTKRPEKLPLTMGALKSVAETHEEFARRRILWAEKILKSQGRKVTPESIRILSSLGHSMIRRPSVYRVFRDVIDNS